MERIPKILTSNKPWQGQLIYRNGFSLRNLNLDFASPRHIHTFKQTFISDTLVSAFREVNSMVPDWTKETFSTLQRKLYTRNEVPKRVNRDFTDTWTSIHKSTNERCSRDLSYLIAHDSLPTCDMLKRRNVIMDNKCQLCRKSNETTKHLFIECEKVRIIRRTVEKIIDPFRGRTLSEEEILYHEGRIKMLKKASRLISVYKHVIWSVRAKLYYGEIDKEDIMSELFSMLNLKMRWRHTNGGHSIIIKILHPPNCNVSMMIFITLIM